MKALKLAARILTFILLTVLTQVGGIVYVVCVATNKRLLRNTKNRFAILFTRFGYFLVVYLLVTFLLVPPVAGIFGRVQMPVFETAHLKPLNILTCFLNRNYVRQELRTCAFEVAREMNQKHPGTVLNYLDGNFPFINKFPLFPHLSHNDGKKLDLAFYYIDKKSSTPSNICPSVIGYGVSEEARAGENNTADFCGEKGYWQYSLLKKIVPQGSKDDFIFDSTRTAELVNLVAAQQDISKIFIEPHLKDRLKLTTEKIRFHGCRAVRHDDHIHIQLQ